MSIIETKLVKYFIFRHFMKKWNYSYLSAYYTYNELIEDFTQNTELSLKQKLHAYKKGFYSERIRSYNLKTEEDYERFIPEIYYYGLHPINGRYSQWIDDKLTIKYMLYPFDSYLPKYFYQINKGIIYKLTDCPKGFYTTFDDVMELIRQEGDITAKILSGTKGYGFYKLSYKKDVYYVNEEITKEEDFFDLIKSFEDYLLTEYIYSCDEFRKIYPRSANTLRVSVINTDVGPMLNGAFMRFGTAKSGVVDNISCGGIFCGVNIDNGKIYDSHYYDRNMKVINIDHHPDTKVSLDITIHNWDTITKKLIEICHYLPQIKYFGYDILITNDGFKILEINSLQGMQHMQLFYPAKGTTYGKKFFNELFMKSKPMKGKV